MLLFLSFYIADFLALKGILRLPWKRSLLVWAVTTQIAGVIAFLIIFKAPITLPQVTNDIGFRSMQALIYSVLDFLMRIFFMGIIFKIRLNKAQVGLLLCLCLVINFAHVFTQVFITR